MNSFEAMPTMLLPENIYRRIPLFWTLMGVLFLVCALLAGSEFRFFYAYLILGMVSLARSMWLYAARQRITRKREVTVLTETQRLVRKR